MKEPHLSTPSRLPARDGAPPALAGRLAAVSLFDLCQFLMLNRKTGNLTIRGPGGGSVYLTFSEGELCSALDDSLRDGVEVVLRAVQWTEGTFEFAPGPVAPERRMNASTENILLDAARQLDELRERSRSDGEAGGAGSAEQAFRDKQVRAASIADAFCSLVAEGDRSRAATGWRDAATNRLLDPAVERLILSADGRAGYLVAGQLEEIPEAAPADVSAWMEQLAAAPAHAPGRTGHARSGAPEARPGPHGLWGLRLESVDGDLVIVTRARRTWPGPEALPLTPAEQATLEALPGGLVAVLGTVGGAPAAWPAWEATAAWLARRAAVRPTHGWVVEEMPRYDWSTLPGRWRRIPPARLRKPGALEGLARASRPGVVVLDGLPRPEILEEAGRLAVAGTLVVAVDGSRQVADWLAAAEGRRSATPARWEPPFAASVVVQADRTQDRLSRRAQLVLPTRATRLTPTSAATDS